MCTFLNFELILELILGKLQNQYRDCLAIKKNKILVHAITWMNLENIMLSERNQTQKVIYYDSIYIGNAQNR